MHRDRRSSAASWPPEQDPCFALHSCSALEAEWVTSATEEQVGGPGMCDRYIPALLQTFGGSLKLALYWCPGLGGFSIPRLPEQWQDKTGERMDEPSQEGIERGC